MPKIRTCSICNRAGTDDQLRFLPRRDVCSACIHKKKCCVCKVIKLKTEFSKDSSKSDNTSSYCLECNKIRHKNRPYSKRKYYKRQRTPNRKLRDFYSDCIKRLKTTKDPNMWSTLGFSKKEFDYQFKVIPNGMDIDHCIPLSWFRDNTPLSISCALPNLQLLDHKTNSSKKNFYCDKPTDYQYIVNSLAWIEENKLVFVKKLL